MVLGTVALVVLAAAILVHARITKRPLPWRPLLFTAGSWAVVYTTMLLASSLTSDERVLDVAQDKKFCGFYLDCHMQVAVTGVDTVREIGLRRANGVFYVVTLRVSSDAVRARVGKEAYDLNVNQYCCGGLNFGYFYAQSPIIAYDGGEHPTYTMSEFTPSTAPRARLRGRRNRPGRWTP